MCQIWSPAVQAANLKVKIWSMSNTKDTTAPGTGSTAIQCATAAHRDAEYRQAPATRCCTEKDRQAIKHACSCAGATCCLSYRKGSMNITRHMLFVKTFWFCYSAQCKDTCATTRPAGYQPLRAAAVAAVGSCSSSSSSKAPKLLAELLPAEAAARALLAQNLTPSSHPSSQQSAHHNLMSMLHFRCSNS